MSTAGIPTFYKGIEYRSMLEARWAAFFTELGWEARYEPFDGVGYIPDFAIHGRRPMLVEVKPASVRAEYLAPIGKVTNGVHGVWDHDILIVGTSPHTKALPDEGWGDPSLGLLGEYMPEEIGGGNGNGGIAAYWDFAGARWVTCGSCGKPAVHHPYQSFACRPCGHYDGDGYLNPANTGLIERAWADATNAVKWRKIA